MIFVTVGSRNYPFDRLFQKLDDLYDEKILTEEMFAQIGTSKYKPRNYQCKDFLSSEEFDSCIQSASIVVSHGASGSIMKALNADKKVIAVTRLQRYGEHINDHQIQNNKAFADNGYVIAVYEMQELGRAFECIYQNTVKLRKWENKAPRSIVEMIDNYIQKNWYEV